MKLITVWNGRMPDGGVVQAVTTSTAVKETNYSLFYHLYFLICIFTFGFENSSNTLPSPLHLSVVLVLPLPSCCRQVSS